MIVTDKAARRIARGEITQLREPAHQTRQCRWRTGNTYPIHTTPQPANQPDRPPVCRIQITNTHLEPIGNITYEAAVACGHISTSTFLEAWAAKHGPNQDRLTWVITFQVDHRQPVRLLHRDSTHGYTADPRLAVPGEPEAVDDKTLAQYAKHAATHHQATRAVEAARREARALSSQLRVEYARAARRGADVTPEITAIRTQLDTIRNKTEEAA